MTEIVKADKQLKKRAYILLLIVVVILAFTQSEYFSNLVTIDTSDMDINQKFEATLQELVYAMSATAFWFLLSAYFSYRLLISVKRTLNEKRYPPINSKVVVDTKVIYGKKAQAQAYLMILGAVLLLGNPIIRAYAIYYGYSVIDEVSKSSIEHQITIDYYFRLRKPDEAVRLIDSLIKKGNNEALFAKASESLKGINLPKDIDNSINTLITMCNEYVEPCLLLAIHHKEQKQYDLSLKYFRKAESKDFTDVYREIRYLYNRSYLNDRGKLNEYTDKMDSAKSSLCGEIYCLTKH
jgi:tetratricopeptide (TPR) repeat protein